MMKCEVYFSDTAGTVLWSEYLPVPLSLSLTSDNGRCWPIFGLLILDIYFQKLSHWHVQRATIIFAKGNFDG